MIKIIIEKDVMYIKYEHNINNKSNLKVMLDILKCMFVNKCQQKISKFKGLLLPI